MKKIILLIALIFILSGCANGDRYNFTGSSENWNVSYEVDVKNGDRERTNGVITFIGEGTAPEFIDYRMESNLGGTKSTGVSVKDKVANLGNDACEGCSVIQENEEITMEIEWDGQTENLILKNNE
ncbi:lipoprotein [Planococcus versutus]|uniref:Lipoprotein n=1 Tax=Planococcus versutus TaxID=1302659 RepID=A0A1B1S399_9BACL|nr:lipoprotein [Planococcus versutus]ANU27664.1 hypothetical protein I858_011770 [Planococcus versutus]